MRGPAVELWLHPEGAVPAALVRDLGRRRGVDLTGLFGAEGDWHLPGPAALLPACAAVAAAAGDPAGTLRLIRAAVEARAAEGVVHAELRLCPDWYGCGELGPWREHLAAAAEALDGAETAVGISARIVVAAPRGAGPERARAAALCAAETAGPVVTGFALAGADAPDCHADFAWAFDCAREAGLGLTAEAGAPHAVTEAVSELRLGRIAVSFPALADSALLDRLAEQDIALDLCPGADVACGLCPRFSAHPINGVRSAGVRLALSSLAPEMLGAPLEWTRERLADAFGWDADVFRGIDRAAATAAFCDADTRKRLLDRLETP